MEHVQLDNNSRLKDIEEEIIDSRYILELKDNWHDDKESYPIDKNAYNNAIQFLQTYSKYILDKFNLVIATPEIDPCVDGGSIDIYWSTKKGKFLINFRENFACIYGFLKNDDGKTARILSIDKFNSLEFNENLANWMKNLI